MTSVYLNGCFRDPGSKYSHSLRTRELDAGLIQPVTAQCVLLEPSGAAQGGHLGHSREFLAGPFSIPASW